MTVTQSVQDKANAIQTWNDVKSFEIEVLYLADCKNIACAHCNETFEQALGDAQFAFAQKVIENYRTNNYSAWTTAMLKNEIVLNETRLDSARRRYDYVLEAGRNTNSISKHIQEVEATNRKIEHILARR